MRVFKHRGGVARSKRDKQAAAEIWAKTGMRLTFRAELMPGRDPLERTFIVASVLANGRVELIGLTGQHAEREFEAPRLEHEGTSYN